MVEVWGKYRLEALLARGGMAEVHRATRVGPEEFEQLVCIKRVRIDLSDDPGFEKLFVREAKIAATLRHPNIVQVTDFDRHEGQLFLAMEFVEGIDLKHLLAEVHRVGARLPVEFAGYVTSGLLAALGYAHGRVVDGKPQPVIHRDVSPHNILISKNGEVKLADFGIAKEWAEGSGTIVDGIKGKAAYFSPEQLDGGDVGPSSDLFSAGLVLYEMLAGKQLFEGRSTSERATRILPRDSLELPWLSSKWNDFLAGMLAADPADRFAGADEAAVVLAELPGANGTAGGAKRVLDRLSTLRGEPGWTVVREPSFEERDTASAAEKTLGDGIGPGDEEGSASPSGADDFTSTSSTQIPQPDEAEPEPEPAAPASPAVASDPGRWGWVKAALAFAAALGLFLGAVYLIQGGTAESAVGEGALPVPIAGDDDAGVRSAAETIAAAVSDGGAAPTGGDGGAGESATRAGPAARGPGFGFLEVNCRPWARVLVDGKDVGTTPIVDLRLRAGRHRVRLVNDERDFRRTFPVDVPRGGTARLNHDIDHTAE